MSEAELLKTYDLYDLNPEEWQGSSSTVLPASAKDARRSRFSVLQSIKSPITWNVDIDDQDPLGLVGNIGRVLQNTGVGTRDASVKASLSINSREFNTNSFLLQVHAQSSYNDLKSGLHVLQRTIHSRSDELKELVADNFDRFVTTKSVIDAVFTVMQTSILNDSSEFGTSVMSDHLAAAMEKAVALYHGVVDNRSVHEKISSAVEVIDANKFIFELPKKISGHIAINNSAMICQDYRKGRVAREEAKSSLSLTTHNWLSALFDRAWTQVEGLVTTFREDLLKQLYLKRTQEGYLQIITQLLEVGVVESPIWVALSAEYDHLNARIAEVSHFHHSRIQYLMRNQNDYSHPALVSEVVLSLNNFVNDLMVDLTKQVAQLASNIEGFIKGRTQKLLPSGFRDESLVHHVLSDSQISQLGNMAKMLAKNILEAVAQMFCDPQSSNNLTASSPSFGQSSSLEEGSTLFIFIPDCATAFEISEFLSDVLFRISSAIIPVADLMGASGESESRAIVTNIRDKCVKVVCNLWRIDSANLKSIQNWRVTDENNDITELPSQFTTYQSGIIDGLRQLIYVSRDGGGKCISLGRPSQSLVMSIRTQFINTLYVLFADMVKAATHVDKKSAPSDLNNVESDVRLILTLSNMLELRKRRIPKLITQFETAFGTDLEQETTTINDTLEQLDTKLFDEFVRGKMNVIGQISREGIIHNDDTWNRDGEVSGVSRYVFEILLAFAVVHARVSQLAQNQVHRAISRLFELVSVELMENLREVDTFSHVGILQATLDLEFLQQTLTYYSSKATNETVQKIFSTFEQAKSDNFSNEDFLSGLSQMKNKLRETLRSTAMQFACFKRPAPPRSGSARAK